MSAAVGPNDGAVVLALAPLTKVAVAEAVAPRRAASRRVASVNRAMTRLCVLRSLSGWDDHTDKETADLRIFGPLTKRAAVFLYRLSMTSAKMQ